MYKVAIVGKPNVGKSTLFNRLTQKRKAITDRTSGITRDRNEAVVEWLTQQFILFDTGGVVGNDVNDLQAAINQQAQIAINEAKIIIFVVSIKEGIDVNDFHIMKLLKKQNKAKVIFVLNKVESHTSGNYPGQEFYRLGFGSPIPIASEHGIGIGDLLDEIINHIPKQNAQNNQNNIEKDEGTIKFCLIGRPNVGKSTIVNALLNEKRVIVSPTAGTTRDAIDINLRRNKKNYVIIDTAGIRKKGKIGQTVENYAVMRSLEAIKRSDVICLVVDGSEQFTEQDEIIGGLAFKANIPTIVLINKCDLTNKEGMNKQQIIENFRRKFRCLFYAPILLISGLQNLNLNKIFSIIDEIRKESQIKISTNILNEIIQRAQLNNTPPVFKGGRIQINYTTQIKSQIPCFVMFCNNPKFLHFSYSRYLENQIRDAFGIHHVPLVLYFKAKESRTRKKSERK